MRQNGARLEKGYILDTLRNIYVLPRHSTENELIDEALSDTGLCFFYIAIYLIYKVHQHFTAVNELLQRYSLNSKQNEKDRFWITSTVGICDGNIYKVYT